MRIPAYSPASSILQSASLVKRVNKPVSHFEAASALDLFAPKLNPTQNVFERTSKESAFRTSLVNEATESRDRLVGQMRDLRRAMLNPQATRTGGQNGTPQQLAITGKTSAGEGQLQTGAVTQNAFEERPIFEARDVTEARPIFEDREVLATRDLFEMRDVTEVRDVMEIRDITEQRDVLATRDITEQRDVFEDRPIYNELNVISTIKLNKEKLQDQKIEAGDQFEITVGDQSARVTFDSKTQLSLQMSNGQTKSWNFNDGAREWREALVAALNSIDGLEASIDDAQYLKLSTNSGQAISLSSGTGDPLAQLGLASRTYELDSATLTGTKRLTDLKHQGWQDTGVDQGEAFSVRIGTGPTANVKFVSDTEVQVDLGDGTPVRSVQFGAFLGEWREGLVAALGAVDGLSARFNEAGQLQLSADAMDQVLTVADVKGDALKDLGLTGGSVSGAITGYERVKTGEETVVVGQETVKVGEETVVVGQETVKVGEETIVVGREQVKVGEETIRVTRQVQVGVDEIVTGQQMVQVGVARVQVGTDSVSLSDKVNVAGDERVARGLAGQAVGSDDQILGYRDGLAGRGGEQARAENFRLQLDEARKSFDQMLEKWRSAGFSLELTLDDLALGEDFLSAIGTREEVIDRATQLESKANTLEQGLGLTAEVTHGGSQDDEVQNTQSPLLLGAQGLAESTLFAAIHGVKELYGQPSRNMAQSLLQRYS